MATAAQYIPDFGVSWECGLRLYDPESVPEMLQLHRQAAEVAL